MKMDKIACECMSVTVGMIKEAVENGAHTLEEVQEKTGAGAGCGACTEYVENLVKHFVEECNDAGVKSSCVSCLHEKK